MFTHCIHLVEAPVVQKTVRYQGRIQGFPKGGVESRDTKCGGGWGGGGAVHLRPDTKSGRGGGVLSI